MSLIGVSAVCPAGRRSSPPSATADDVYVWEVPASALVGAATTQVVVFQAGSPDAYSATLTASQSTGC
ncbi:MULTISPECIES: hypothetical protein [Sorangium]|uniref:hypothetical protein n=1 Tax=Sorangium TaxID=39643 RepID=UPI001A91A06D|nr:MULTISPECIES: hypothetical protein [Sorangium]